ncbi:proton-conducting transporter membrane subunit [Acidocella sp.]|jgi:hydrogenase-4 component F|uniref:proton-conducting transporter transmembrane domain-containing protein n=1 Tax=Acidocella sp. TaxID=50710 RepID=UPI002F4120A2
MNFPAAASLLPLIAAVPLGLFGTPRQGAIGNLFFCFVTFLLTLGVFVNPGAGLVHADSLGMMFGVLTGFVGLTTAIGNLGFVASSLETLSLNRWRVYHAMFQVVLGACLLGLYADNLGLLWVALEGATIAGTVAVSLPRSASALEAAWKYFILGGVGIALALFGTMLTYLAAQPALGPGLAAMSFSALAAHGAALDGQLLTLAFVFLLFGYGTKAALVPLHGWLPDAYAEGPAPVTTAMSSLTLNVALLAILRFRHVLQENFRAGGGAMQPGPFLLTLGLASLLLTAFSLPRRRDARRFFGFSSIEHSGLAAFAFGIGGAAAIFGGLLHMMLHTLIKSALFQALIRAAAARGSAAPGHYAFAHLRGLGGQNYLGWALAGAMFALTGMPPSGMFASEFIIISQTIQRDPLLSLPLGLGMVLCAVPILRHLGPLLFDAPPQAKPVQARAESGLVALHLLLAFALAFAMPFLVLHILTSVAAGLQ